MEISFQWNGLSWECQAPTDWCPKTSFNSHVHNSVTKHKVTSSRRAEDVSRYSTWNHTVLLQTGCVQNVLYKQSLQKDTKKSRVLCQCLVPRHFWTRSCRKSEQHGNKQNTTLYEIISFPWDEKIKSTWPCKPLDCGLYSNCSCTALSALLVHFGLLFSFKGHSFLLFFFYLHCLFWPCF